MTTTNATDQQPDASSAPPTATERRKAMPYSIVLASGTDNLPPIDVPTVDITPTERTASGVLARIKEAGLSVADVRTDALLVFGTDDVVGNLVVYAAIVGLSGRFPDVAVNGRILPAGALNRKVRRQKDAGRPPQRPVHVQIGTVGRHDMVEIPFEQLPDAKALSLTRAAKRCRLVPPAEALAALHQMVAVSGVRARGNEERMPFIVAGTEPAAALETAKDPIGVDLEQVRRDAVAMRREVRGDDRNVLVDAEPLSDRQQQLLKAGEVDVLSVLDRLGVSFDAIEDRWVCPRTHNHPEDDPVAFLNHSKGKMRCGRCDAERLDVLRLVMELRRCTPDEAADWLLADAA